MPIRIKLTGITKRWIINVLSVVAIIVVSAILAFSMMVYSYFYDSIFNYIALRATAIEEVVGGTTIAGYNASVVQLAEEFRDLATIEIQFTDRFGNLMVSTTGTEISADLSNHFSNAVNSGGELYRFIGRNEQNQQIMAVTQIFYTDDGTVIGAARYIVALDNVNRHIFNIILMTSLLGAGLILFSVLMGLYFAKSIVRPIKAISTATRKIALGNFDTELKFNQNDEIGELCDVINFMASELQAAEKTKQEFISSVSHELRTPLTAIKGWAETLRAGETDPEFVNRGMEVIVNEAARLNTLIEDMLDLENLTHEGIVLQKDECNITQIIYHAFTMYEELARQNGITMSLEQYASTLRVYGDRNRLIQVFVNLVDNAVKYNKSGGKVKIATDLEDDFIKISISDTGCGIPEMHLDKVREKFFKGNQLVKGSGIGLAVADEIIKKHDGVMTIDSVEDEGTTVVVLFEQFKEKINNEQK